MIWRRKNGSPAMQFAADYLADRIQRKKIRSHRRGGRNCSSSNFWRGGFENCVRQTGIPRVALSGGVFMKREGKQKDTGGCPRWKKLFAAAGNARTECFTSPGAMCEGAFRRGSSNPAKRPSA